MSSDIFLRGAFTESQTHHCVTKAASLATSCWSLGEKHGVNDLVSSWIGILGLADTWMTPHKEYGGMLCFSVVLFHLKKDWVWLFLTSIVLDSAATKSTPETLEVFCELKHFTHSFISIVVSR